MEPFEEGFRPFEYYGEIVSKWETVKIPKLKTNENHFKWLSENTVGEFSITPKGMAFSEAEDALFYKLHYGNTANEPE